MNEVHFTNFPPGSVIAFDISMEPPVKKALGMLRWGTVWLENAHPEIYFYLLWKLLTHLYSYKT